MRQAPSPQPKFVIIFPVFLSFNSIRFRSWLRGILIIGVVDGLLPFMVWLGKIRYVKGSGVLLGLSFFIFSIFFHHRLLVFPLVRSLHVGLGPKLSFCSGHSWSLVGWYAEGSCVAYLKLSGRERMVCNWSDWLLGFSE